MPSCGSGGCGTSRRRNSPPDDGPSSGAVRKGGGLCSRDQKTRTILVLAIAVTVFAAVFVSLGLPALTGRAPEVVLPDVNQEAVSTEGRDFLPVEVRPDTVQSVIVSLSRPESYYRQLTVRLFWAGGSSADPVEIWADGGYVRTAITTGGSTQYRLVGEGKLRLWYAGDRAWQEVDAGDDTADLAQRIPTYEDVLELDTEQISAASYEEKNEAYCIFVEVKRSQDVLDRYWIDTDTGLLCAAETYEEDTKVYEMTETQLRAPLEDGIVFSLPDGTILHESSSVTVPEE